jgi:hypothetical protein
MAEARSGERKGGGRGGSMPPRLPPPALTADVCVGRQAVAEQFHVPTRGIHAARWGQLPCPPTRSARSDRSPQPRAGPNSLRQALSMEERPQAPPWRERFLN